MANWIDVGAATDFPPGAKACVSAGGQPVVVCHVQGPAPLPGAAALAEGETRLCAVLNVCPHAGLPLGDGELNGLVLTCPYHGYAYNVATGTNVDFPRDEPPVPRLPVRVRDGRVDVDVEGRE